MLNVKVDDNDNIIEYDIDFLGGFLNGEFAYPPLSVALTFALLIDRIIMDNETKDKLDLYNNRNYSVPPESHNNLVVFQRFYAEYWFIIIIFSVC